MAIFTSAIPKLPSRQLSSFSFDDFEAVSLDHEKKHAVPIEKSFPDYIEGILLFNEIGALIHVNQQAIAIIQRISRHEDSRLDLPQEIAHIKAFMVESRRLFPQQSWQNNSMIFVDCSTIFQVHARWMQGNHASGNFLLLRMEDQNQFARNIALEESKRFGLTPREQEVWLLYRANYTYKQIATALEITPNTVKKHMKSILTKQRSLSESADAISPK